MKALVKIGEGAGQIELRDIDKPEPRPGEVVLEAFAAIQNRTVVKAV